MKRKQKNSSRGIKSWRKRKEGSRRSLIGLMKATLIKTSSLKKKLRRRLISTMRNLKISRRRRRRTTIL